MGVGAQRNATPRPLCSREETRLGVWVGPRVGLNGCGKSRLFRESILGQLIASRCTDYAVPAHNLWELKRKLNSAYSYIYILFMQTEQQRYHLTFTYLETHDGKNL